MGNNCGCVNDGEVESDSNSAAFFPKECANEVAVEAEVDSGDDSEEEWNYIPGRNNKKAEKKPQVETPESPVDAAEEEDDMSQLNPNAAEFVPVFGAEKVLASSPAKGAEKSMDDVIVPKQNDFLNDIATKPSELDDDIGYELSFGNKSVNETSVVESPKEECVGDLNATEEIEDEAVKSSNPFDTDSIQMVQDHFSENESLGFKPFDPMQNSMVVLDSSPTIPAGTELYDFLTNSDKPDILSPTDNFSYVNNEQHKSSSSGFESESGNEIEVGAADKCDLVAGIPLDNDVEEPSAVNQHTEDYSITNPFSENASDEKIVEESIVIDKSPFFEVDNKFESNSLKEPSIEDASDVAKPPEVFNVESDTENNEQPFNGVPPSIDYVDLISNTEMADTSSSLIGECIKESCNDIVPNESENAHIEYSFKDNDDVCVTSQSAIDDRPEEPKDVEVTEPIQERDDHLNVQTVDEVVTPIDDDKSKDDSMEINDFEIISHDDAELNHMQQMNGGIHLEEVDPSPDNYKFDDFVQKEHTVEIHAEKSSSVSAFNCDTSPLLDVYSVVPDNATLENIVEKQDQVVEELVEEVAATSTTLDDEFNKDSPLISLAGAQPVENKDDEKPDSVVELTKTIEELTLTEPEAVEELVEQVIIPEPEKKQEEMISLVDHEISPVENAPSDDVVKSLMEEALGDEIMSTSLHVETSPIETPESLPVTPSAPLSEDLLTDAALNKESPEEIPKDEEPKLESQEIPVEVPVETQVDDFHKQNGHVADVCTPPSTPAPGVELDNKEGLIAAAVAVAAAGVASAATAATAVSGASKTDDKTAKKPAAKPLPSARPGSAKAPAKPGTASAAAKKPTTVAAATKAPVSAAKTTATKAPVAAKTSTVKPTTAKAPAKPATTTATAKAPASKSTVGATAKPPTPTTRTSTVASKTVPPAKPKTPTTTTPSPIKKPAAPGPVTKTATTTVAAAKKPEASKPLVSKTTTAARTTVAAPRPTSATKPATASSTRPTSATKPAPITKPAGTTKPAPITKPAGTTKPVAAKTTATATSTTKAATTVSKTATTTKTAPLKPKPAAPTDLKRPTSKDATNKSTAPKGPIKKPVPAKTKVPDKGTKGAEAESEKIVETPTQVPAVSTTNGLVDVIENGVSHCDESPVDVSPCPVIEAEN